MTTGRDGESGSGAQGDGAGVALASWQHGRAARRWAGWRRSSPVRQRRLGELDEGRRASGMLAAEPAAAALQGDHGGGASSRARRRRFRTSSLLLFLSTEFLAREFQGLSHGEVTSKLSFFIHFKTSTRYSFLPSLYRREKETGCPKGNLVIRRGFGPKRG